MATAYANVNTYASGTFRQGDIRVARVSGRYRPSTYSFSQEFEDAVSKWRAETAHLSLMNDKMSNDHFTKIVDWGWKAVPLIIEEIRSNPDLLFVTLHLITGENPTVGVPAGDMRGMIAAWLTWAEQNLDA